MDHLAFFGVKIALTGKMRSGKDTVAEHLKNDYGFKRYAFGDGIRKACHEFFPEIVGQGKPRFLYQGIGQDFRQYDPDIWVKWMFGEIKRNASPINNMVVTDLRQTNEFEAVKDAGFVVVRVNCSDHLRLERMKTSGDNFTPDDLTHETEQHIDSFDANFDIQNDGSIQELIQEVEVVLGMLEGKFLWAVLERPFLKRETPERFLPTRQSLWRVCNLFKYPPYSRNEVLTR